MSEDTDGRSQHTNNYTPLLTVFSVGVLLVILIVSCQKLAINDATHGPVLFETFDDQGSSFSEKLLRHSYVSIEPEQGVDRSRSIKVTYEGYERGSRRVVVTHPLRIKSMEATLSYDVRFCQGFDFVKGGKLHGLAPEEPVTGGNPVSDEKWSARISFHRKGGVGAYLYHQDLTGQYGEIIRAEAFNFSPDRYYAISLYVRVNNPPNQSNGIAEIYIDGERVVRRDNIRFRGIDGSAGLVGKILFHTFHGGNTEDFAPRQRDGSYSTECAFFDNLAVYPYKKIKQAPGGRGS